MGARMILASATAILLLVLAVSLLILFLILLSSAVMYFILRLIKCFHPREESAGEDHVAESSTSALQSNIDPRVLALLPVYVCEKEAAAAEAKLGECVICLNNLEEKDEYTVLPECNHWFHRECINKWLLSKSTCPVCRAELKFCYIENMV